MLLWISLMGAALSLTVVLWLLLSPGAQHAQGYYGPWTPWVQAMGNWVCPFLTWSYQIKLDALRQQAGVAQQLSRHALAGAKGSCASIAAVVGLWLCLSLSMPLLHWPLLVLPLGWLGWSYPSAKLQRLAKQRKNLLLKHFPFFLDMTTLCVESGLNLQGALQQTVQALPPTGIRQELQHVLDDIRTGKHRLQALREMADRIDAPAIHQWVGTIAQAEQFGMSLGDSLRAQAEQRRQERFLDAEKRALQAPVKMLFPMVLFIFPCTFMMIAYPMALTFLRAGV